MNNSASASSSALASAPDFSLPATGGTTVSLSSLRGRKFVLYFYPKNNTPGCTNESIDFRDQYADFAAAGYAVFGVSRDSLQSHEKFKEKLGLPFELLSDEAESACNAFDVIRMKNLYGKQVQGIERSTFVIDGDGRILKVWRKAQVPGHVSQVLEFIQQT